MKRVIVLLGALAIIAGCRTKSDWGQEADPDRILHMAGEEAGQVANAHARLTRQLNIANRQHQNAHQSDARLTLAQARKTLENAPTGQMTDHQSLAGWISISELLRQANDPASAGSALDQAIAHLQKLTPTHARCEYVRGVAHEIKLQRGKQDAARLLAQGGQWAVELPEQSNRRSAFVSFTFELFLCGDYEAGRAVLQNDKDAAWRSDSLITMSNWANSHRMTQFRQTGMMNAEATPGASTDQQMRFGKSLDFQSNYYRGQ